MIDLVRKPSLVIGFVTVEWELLKSTEALKCPSAHVRRFSRQLEQQELSDLEQERRVK